MLGTCSVAAAAPPPAVGPSGVALVQKDCPELDEHALRELFELELRTLSVTDSRVRVEIACSNDVAVVSLTDAEGSSYPIASRVDFSKVGAGARERLIAIAATELVAQAEHASRSNAAEKDRERKEEQERERQRTQAAGIAAAEPGHAEPSPKDAAPAANGHDQEPRTELSLLAVGTVTGTPTTFLGGGALGVRVRIAGPWAAMFDVRLDGGATDTVPARVVWTMLGGSAAFLFEQHFGVAHLGVGAGVRAAHLALDASAPAPDSGRTVRGAWLGPMLPVRARFLLAPPVALLVTLEGGYVTLPVRGVVEGGEPIVEADGPWISLGVGVAAVF
jgi:hypothetical protein